MIVIDRAGERVLQRLAYLFVPHGAKAGLFALREDPQYALRADPLRVGSESLELLLGREADLVPVFEGEGFYSIIDVQFAILDELGERRREYHYVDARYHANPRGTAKFELGARPTTEIRIAVFSGYFTPRITLASGVIDSDPESHAEIVQVVGADLFLDSPPRSVIPIQRARGGHGRERAKVYINRLPDLLIFVAFPRLWNLESAKLLGDHALWNFPLPARIPPEYPLQLYVKINDLDPIPRLPGSGH